MPDMIELIDDLSRKAFVANDDAIFAFNRGDKAEYERLANEADRRAMLASQLYRQHYQCFSPMLEA